MPRGPSYVTISFGHGDCEGVQYSLVVTLLVVNDIKKRVLIDNESSADILFWSTFMKMKKDLSKLCPTLTPLKKFSKDMVLPVDAITLLVKEKHHYQLFDS